MLYAGIKYQYCEDIFTVWLIIGGVLCYVNFIMAIVYIYAKKTQSPKTKWKEDLKNHVQNQHKGIYFKCEQCDKKVARETLRRNHLQTKHKAGTEYKEKDAHQDKMGRLP